MSASTTAAETPRRSVSFRSSLLRNLVLLILLLAVAILAVSIAASRRAVRTLCQDLVTSSVSSMETELERFFEPIEDHLRTAHTWAQEGLLNEVQAERMNAMFTPILEAYPQISSLNTGDEDGDGFMLLRHEGAWLNRMVVAGGQERDSEWRKFGTLGGEVETWSEDIDYDPRSRPWFELAMASEPGEVRWTEPYTFFTTKEPGITASCRMVDDAGRSLVLSFDLLLKDITSLTASFDRSPRGFTLITTVDGRLVGLPRDATLQSRDAQNAAFMKRPSELGIPLVEAAGTEFRRHFRLEGDALFSVEQGQSPENVPFRWMHDGLAWWTAVRPCLVDGGPQLWIGVTVPEDDFLGELKQVRRYYILLAALALLLAAAISVHLARRYNQPIQHLIEQSDRLTTLDTSKVPAAQSEIREISQLYEAQERMRLALDSFARYVPSDVVRDLLDKGEAAVIGGRQRMLSMLFTDIAGFTTISESMGPEALTAHMAEYFDEMLTIIERHGGTVDKLIGDAIVAFWGAPRDDKNHAHHAVQAALECASRLEELGREWEAKGLPPLPTRFGISSGDVVVGNVGSPGRLSYTALGDAVNLASRLEGANSFYGTTILASSTTVQQAKSETGFEWRRVDKVAVKGRATPELIYEPLAPDADRGFVRRYEQALDAYLERKFAVAIDLLDGLSDEDASVVRLRGNCESCLASPPSEGWDGVSRFDRKS